MAALDQPVEVYLSQLHAIQIHDTRSRLKSIKVPTLVLAGADDILIPMNLSRELHSLIPGAAFATAKGGHALCGSTRSRSTTRSWPSSESTAKQANSTYW